MIPKIDYKLLGNALGEYEDRGYTYVEVPWAVPLHVIRATLPAQFPALTMCEYISEDAETEEGYFPFNQSSSLVGSAEQGFLSLDLPAGRYVGVTPCFRPEPVTDLLHQYMFIKLELFCKFDEEINEGHVDRVLWEAEEVMGALGRNSVEVKNIVTTEGYDLEIGGIEVGSYGKRSWRDQHWVYGTGLALPRYSIAAALSTVL